MGAGTREAEQMARKHEAVNGEEPQELREVQRWSFTSKGMMACLEGDWVCLKDAEKWYKTAQDLLGKNLILSVENEALKETTRLHHELMVNAEARGIKKAEVEHEKMRKGGLIT